MRIPTKQFRIAGFVPLSTVDWPDQLAAVLFTQGCPWRCGYCHNAHLIKPCAESLLDYQTVFESINKRRFFLDGVVISGGEPLLQRGLLDAILAIRSLGLKVGIHTSGSLPKQLDAVLPYIDWVGLDIKALPEHYAAITHRAHSAEAAWESLALLVASGVDYEVRVTAHPHLLPVGQLDHLLDRLVQKQVKHIRVQSARPPFFDAHLQSGSLVEHQRIFNQHQHQFMSAQWR